MRRLALAVVLILVTGAASAKTPAPPQGENVINEMSSRTLFGAEWTFGSKRTHESPPEKRIEYVREFRDRVLAKCAPKGCISSELPDMAGFRVTYPDGWYMDLVHDLRVVEVNTKPTTYERFRELQPRIDADLYSVAKELKMFGGVGAGHIHVGVESAFGDDALGFRNFIVDYFNHPGMAAGGMGGHEPAFHNLDHEARLKFARIIDDFDSGRMPRTILDLATRIQGEVYDQSVAKGFRGTKRWKNNALNLFRVRKGMPPSHWTMEFRNVNQSSSEQFMQQLEVFNARISKIRQVRGPIAIDPRVLKPRVRGSYVEFLDDFKRYVGGAGLNPNYYSEIQVIGFIELNPGRGVLGCLRDLMGDVLRLRPKPGP